MSVTRLTCSSCDARLKVSGVPEKAVKCPRCGKPIRVPEPEPEDDFEFVDESEEEEEAPAPKKRPVAARKASRPSDEEAEDEDDPDDEPAPKKRRDAITSKSSKAPARKPSRDDDDDEEDDPDEEPTPKKRRDAITSKAGKTPARKPSRDDDDDDDDDPDEEPTPKKRRDGITSKAGGKAASSGRSRDEDPDDDEDEDDDRPRKRGKGGRKQKKGSPMLLWVGIGGGGLLVVAGVVVALVLLLGKKEQAQIAAPPPGGGAVQPPKPKGYQSPQEVFDARLDATKRKDAKGCIACLAPEGRKEALVMMTHAIVAIRLVAAEDVTGVAKKFEPFYPVLDKHGLTTEATLKVIPKVRLDEPFPEEPVAQQRGEALLKLVKDRDALLVDLSQALLNNADLKDASGDTGTLKDVVITGDKAKGKVSYQITPQIGQPGQTVKIEKDIEFVKIDDGWLILREKQ